jgi:DDE family transposase
LRLFINPCHCLSGKSLIETPNAIDQMFSYFAVVQDPRRQHFTTLHSLEAIITITILATMCGAQNWLEIECRVVMPA